MPIGINNVAEGDPNTSLARRVADLERLVRELAAAPTLQNSTLAQGSLNITGGDVSVAGGSFTLYDTTGTVLFRIGPQQYGDRGVTAFRADGSVAFRVAKIFGPSDTQQRFQFFDLSGIPIGGDAALSQSGFDSPHVPHMWRPIDRSDARTITSATALNTWLSLFEHRGVRGNPGLPVTFSVLCSDATTAGQLQVLDMASGLPMAAFFSAPWVGSIPAGTTTETFITSPSLVLTEVANTTIRLQVQVQRTAGTGTISVAIAQSVGGSA
jgi:hypothetical protein